MWWIIGMWQLEEKSRLYNNLLENFNVRRAFFLVMYLPRSIGELWIVNCSRVKKVHAPKVIISLFSQEAVHFKNLVLILFFSVVFSKNMFLNTHITSLWSEEFVKFWLKYLFLNFAPFLRSNHCIVLEGVDPWVTRCN